jgi:hypothetical protein
VTTGPSPQGVADLRNAAASLARSKAAAPRPARRPWLTKRWVAVFLAVDLVAGTVAWHYLTATHATAAAAAVEGTASDAAHKNWTGVYNRLCSSDRSQITEANLAGVGRAALLQIGGLEHATVTGVTPVTLPVGPIHWPAEQVSGNLERAIGAPSPYTVTVIRELGSWKVCLSAGGYSSSALGVKAPLGNGSIGSVGGFG